MEKDILRTFGFVEVDDCRGSGGRFIGCLDLDLASRREFSSSSNSDQILYVGSRKDPVREGIPLGALGRKKALSTEISPYPVRKASSSELLAGEASPAIIGGVSRSVGEDMGWGGMGKMW